MQERKIIAIFGGSFNPPLNSHFQFAERVVNEYENIERIIFVPVSDKYNKRGLISNEHRYNMLKLMCNKNPKFLVSRIEIDSETQPYTIETLEQMKDKYLEDEIWLIIGSDNLKQLPRWKDPDKLLKEFKVIVIQRDNDNVDKIILKDSILSRYKNSFIKFVGIAAHSYPGTCEQVPLQQYKSSYVRKLIVQGKPYAQYMSEEVHEYIEKNNLYK